MSEELTPSPPFVHLHVHTQYSLLEGAISIDALMTRVVHFGMNAIAMTDSNNLFGAIDFYLSARKAKIKPIIGCEVTYVPEGRSSLLSASLSQGQSTPAAYLRGHHLVLLCQNLKGYQNLCELVTRSYTENFSIQKRAPLPLKAFIDRALLDRFGDGLIVLSGCLRGEIPTKILTQDEDGALQSLKWFQNRFKENFFLELQDHALPEQEMVNDVLYQWSKKFGIPCVATSDCHYLEPEHAEAHEVLQCIEHGRNLDFERPKSLVVSEYYLKAPSLMKERFERFPGAFENAALIASRCELEFCFKDKKGKPIYHLPKFRPEGLSTLENKNFDLNSYFFEQARSGLKERFLEPSFAKKIQDPNWSQIEKTYWERLNDELQMIEKTGFAGYFLIVADFISWAKKNGIPVGPGRGSGAGSLVAYALKIIDLDPIQYNLLFERFINPERISLPDFDVDFCQERRGEVINYVTQKYGAQNVCQIITFGKLLARGVVKDVGRVLGFSFSEMDQITKLMPDELHLTLKEALEKEPRLREKCNEDSRIAKVFEYAQALEGLSRNAGVHAAGVIITEHPVVTYCPLFVGRDGVLVTQLDKDSADAIGLVKFDFLGLKTLTVIDHAVKLIREGGEPGRPEALFSLETINMEDTRVFALIGFGDTDGVFQVESSGMKDLCVRIQPNSIEDLTAINALYRPGPLGSGMVDDFIDRKHGRKPMAYEVPSLEPILRDTYGVILYQEQVMRIARELSGYSLGQADLLRRAMGKKKPAEMAKHRETFVMGAFSKGLSKTQAEAIFDLMAKFAEYGFNKSHSAAYAVLTYQTAYLKTYYPAEFMAALMTTEMDNTDKITKYIQDARAHQILVLPPDVNTSQRRFSVQRFSGQKAIRFGLEAIKGVGSVAVDAILEARKEGLFKNVLDFCRRVPSRKVNKKVLESLTLAGAFDPIAEVHRASLFASIETLLEHASDEQEERELGQTSLFDAFQVEEVKFITPVDRIFKNEPEWPISRKLAKEKEVVGFFVSGHPMDLWQKICEEWLGWSTERIKKLGEEKAQASKKIQIQENSLEIGAWGGGPRSYRPQRAEVKIGGLLSTMREITTKKGTRMAFAELEDLRGKVELVFFPEAFTACQEFLKKALVEAEPVLLTGELEIGEETPKIFGKTLEWLREAHDRRVKEVVILLQASKVSDGQMRELKKCLLQNRGKCSVRIEFVDPSFKTQMALPQTFRVNPTIQMVKELNRIFGQEVVQLR